MKNKYEAIGPLDVIYHTNVTVNDLRGVSTPSENVAWISGNNGTVICTIDGGMNWIVKKIPGAENLDFRDIKAFDENTAYVMSVGYAKNSCIYKTNDGGQTWALQLQGQNSSEFFNCMAFWNLNHGLVLCDPMEGKFKLYTTRDGSTWSAIPSDGMPKSLSEEGAFAASGSCLTVFGNTNVWFGTGVNTARVFSSSDNGFNWKVSDTPIKKDTGSSGIFSITFADLEHGMIAGGDYNNPNLSGSNLAITLDGGVTWVGVEISPQYYWSAISLTPDKHHFMVVGSTHAGYTSSVFNDKKLMTRNECKTEEVSNNKLYLTWEKSWNNVNFNAFSFWKKDSAIVVGPQGVIAEIKTTDHKM